MENKFNVAPINLDEYLGKVKNRIHLVGYELEGAWKHFPKEETYEWDGSVFEDPTPEDLKAFETLNLTQAGELPSKPMFPAETGLWMKRCYPNYSNKTCGLHVHMSFKTLKHYAQLMVPEFPLTMRWYIGLWAANEGFKPEHHIWKRLNGESVFCHSSFWPDKQVKALKDHNRQRDGNRYTDINYCFTAHSTIECRILPMMETWEQATRAANRVLQVTNAFLVKTANRQIKEIGVLEMPDPEDDIERDVIEIWD